MTVLDVILHKIIPHCIITCIKSSLWTVTRNWLIHANFWVSIFLTRKVGQTDLAFNMWSGFISRSLHASFCVHRLRFVSAWL